MNRSAVAFVSLACLVASSVVAQEGAEHRGGPPEIRVPVAHDVSKPLRDITPVPPKFGKKEREHPRFETPPGSPDGALQADLGPLVAATPGLGFEGVGLGNGYDVLYSPPDTVGAAGINQYVQWVNVAFAVFNKATGAQIYPAGPGFGGAAGNTIWSGFTAGNCDENNDGDPIVLYDRAAGRWVMTQFSVSGGPPYFQCIAVSTSEDATGSYNRYAYQFTGFNDYPKFGAWPDAYYASYNMFSGESGGKACAYDRAKMLAGNPAPQQVCFATSYSVLPSDLDGSTAPPAGEPNYFLRFSTNSLQLYKFHVDWTNTASSTFTGPTTIPVASFAAACGGGACITQGGSRQKLDSLGDRLMYRLAYRNFGGYASLVVNHSVNVSSGSGKKPQTNVGIRWYELRVSGGVASVHQQGTFSPDTSHRWMGSVAMDKVGNIGLGYSKSSSSMDPAIFYTGRLATDPLGTLQAEAQIIAGGGSQGRSLSRWGDYSTLTLDPVDDCRFWYTTEYLATDGTWNWRTRVSSFKFPNCN